MASGSTDRNRNTNLHEDAPEPSARGTSPARMHSGQRLVDRMPANPKKMVFMSTQEIFEVPLRPEHESHNYSCRKQHNSDDSPSDGDFVAPPVARGSKRSRPTRRPSTMRKPALRTETRRANHVPFAPGLETGPKRSSTTYSLLFEGGMTVTGHNAPKQFMDALFSLLAVCMMCEWNVTRRNLDLCLERLSV